MVCALALPAFAARADEPTVILLSFDGVHPQMLERGELGALDRMRREGGAARGLVPVWPANTFPNHVSLATGTFVDTHGIVGNRFWDPERGLFDYDNDASWMQAEPIWVAAERQGVRAAVFFWVGSETDWKGRGATYRKTPFSGGTAESEKVDQIVAWLDLPAAKRPRLILSWWHGADSVAHRTGPADPAVFAQLEAQDRELGRLLSALDARDAWAHTTLLVVSDHGMAAVTESIDLEDALGRVDANARVIRAGGAAYVFVRNRLQLDAARDALRGIDHVRVFDSKVLPPALRGSHPTRSGDLVVLTDPPYTLNRPRLAGVIPLSPGGHGYEPDRPDMSAILLALGRGVSPGADLGRPRTIDVAPTVAHLLAIDPPLQSEGVPIPGLGGPQARAGSAGAQ